jgi:hypothetical protein
MQLWHVTFATQPTILFVHFRFLTTFKGLDTGVGCKMNRGHGKYGRSGRKDVEEI